MTAPLMNSVNITRMEFKGNWGVEFEIAKVV